MFNDILSGLLRIEDAFNRQVRDSFGRSVDEEVFRPATDKLQQLEYARSEAELKEKEIQALTLELRMIL